MPRGPLLFFPFVIVAAFGLLLLLLFLFVLIQVGLVTVAFSKLGLTTGQAFLVLLATLLGSGVNLPVHRSNRLVKVPAALGPGAPALRRRYRPFPDPWAGEELREQIIAVNVGGCLVPCLLSLYFLSQTGLSAGLLLALAAVTLACHQLARPVPGVGIAIPVLLPPLIAAASALLLAPPGQSAHVAYVSGSLGTLLGADVLRLVRAGPGDFPDAPVLSIGGAGTFDGVFLTGVIAVLLA